MINANRLKLYHPPDHRRDLGSPEDEVPRQDPMHSNIVPPNVVQPPQKYKQPDQNHQVNDRDNTVADADVQDDPIQDIDQNKTYEISRILKARKNKGKPEFLIKWAGALSYATIIWIMLFCIQQVEPTREIVQRINYGVDICDRAKVDITSY
ncbi:unnamed protein product [Mytilus coruscus]|uniref:Chromo domain-containing protein n=1 Tax=Mytilus coruscus TaxID=42192 RepID=A0A6J8DLQ9_MYTCO|nr:unnamed protein product [Mytilus coruscus]